MKVLLFSLIVGVLIFSVRVFASLPLSGKIIVIDPGHGGVDPGASHLDVLEKDLNLQVSLILEQMLGEAGASVVLTRDGDYDLSKPNAVWRKKSDFDNRIKLINELKADMYISVHMNHLPQEKYFGAQVFYLKNDDFSNQIAESIQVQLNKDFKFDKEIKQIPNTTYMYSKLEVPGVLIECGFLSNYSEMKNLQTSEYQKKLAKTIAQGIIDVLN